MPLPFLFSVIRDGPPPWLTKHALPLIYGGGSIAALSAVKWYSSGAVNKAECKLHGKVVLLTGGTSGVGQRVAHELAARGAQLVLLTQTPVSDPFLAEYIQELRDTYDNHLIYAEQVDLTSLHSVRKFATKWVDNAPPRRIDMIILCAATLTPPGHDKKETPEGVEETYMVNYLANVHLLSILSPAIRAQPFDRNVRIIIASCSSYIGAPSLKEAIDDESWTPSIAYKQSKLALNVFAQSYQKHLDAYKRPDHFPNNARVIMVDPGYCRTPGMWRWLTRGSLIGLGIYVATYIVPWVLLKSPHRGAQSFLHAAMDPMLGRGEGGRLVKECREVDWAREEIRDEEVGRQLWEETDGLIERVEKAQAKRRAVEKRQRAEEKATKAKEDKEAARAAATATPEKTEEEEASQVTEEEEKEPSSDYENMLKSAKRKSKTRAKEKEREAKPAEDDVSVLSAESKNSKEKKEKKERKDKDKEKKDRRKDKEREKRRSKKE
ncbi:hypothetical protein N3K66_008312 [Trichothecium roseum]|uniref:Uncharacterized protein n=1 Tax=Trichothecium roseum TaxID=47278 RepID=A0ACC0UT37_9HYPO|nr:hypothetical protein N3K66_008312 [Trichothecium roseum]